MNNDKTMQSGTTHDYDSIVNQEIKQKMVHQEVSGCHTTEVNYILSRWDYNDAPFTYDDVENLYLPYCPECGEHATDFEEIEGGDSDVTYRCEECGHIYSEGEHAQLDTASQEIYEWYAVTGYLAGKLREYGECVLDAPLGCYWGRQTTGQAVLLDYVISRICEDMEILDGQRYAWTNRTA